VILLDMTCLVYAVGGDHERREPYLALVTAIAEQRVIARTTTRVIAEFAHVRGRRRDRSDASSLGVDALDTEDRTLRNVDVLPVMTAARAAQMFEAS
jgi:predicted nucleic acid-binding protein